MSAYERLAEEKRTSRRTIADALEVLREAAGFADHDQAAIDVGPMQLPSGQILGLVQILFRRSPEKTFIVSLPTSTAFQAILDGASRREKFDISRLHGATVDGDGHVLLTDGLRLRAVEVIPEHLPLKPSELDWRIVHHTISLIGAERRCYRHLGDGLEPPYRDMVPKHLRFLDCSRLSGLAVPRLKVIARYIADRDPTLRKLSQQKIADTLRKFGIRRPISRPHVQN